MKSFIILAVCLFMFQSYESKSQSLYPISLQDKINASTEIVEGKITERQGFWNSGRTMIYTQYQLDVYKVFKGNTTVSKLFIVLPGGVVGNDFVYVSDNLEMDEGDIGLFFLKTAPFLSGTTSGVAVYDVYSASQGFFKYDLVNKTASAPFVSYANISQQVYSDIQSKTGITYTDINPQFNVDNQRITATRSLTASITSFSPAAVNAGAFSDPTNNILTINGSGFTTATATSGINFDNPDDGPGGTPLFVPGTSNVIISWTDNQIQVRVPAKVGTGNFSVVDNTGAVSAVSATPLQVNYAIINLNFGTASSPVYRMLDMPNNNGSGGYNYYYSTNTANRGTDFSTAPEKASFERAITTWKEIAGLNFNYSGTTTTQAVSAGDGTNIIMMDNTATGNAVLPAGVLGVCYSSGSACTPSYYAYSNGFDIVIRKDGVSNGTVNMNLGPCKTTASPVQYDLETVMLHELGHALTLGHINDSYIGISPNIDPGKVMHYAIMYGADRRSPDWSAYTGAKYAIAANGISYGTCTVKVPMTPLSTTVDAKDECGTFPSTATPKNTMVNFDLTHATSNKTADPAPTKVNLTGTTIGITNNAYYAIKTNNVGGTLDFAITNYQTTPADLSACTGTTGVELSLYQVSSCPAGQSFPTPFAYRTFSGNGALTSITGLAANTNYLIMADGISGTKASFSLNMLGSALPLRITLFKGFEEKNANKLEWTADNILGVSYIDLEASETGNDFYKLYKQDVNSSQTNLIGQFSDFQLQPLKYYRLKVVDLDGSFKYSDVVAIKRNLQGKVLFYPNPVTDLLHIKLQNIKGSRIQVQVVDLAGRVVMNQSYSLSAAQSILSLNVNNKLSAGTYQLIVTDAEKCYCEKLLVQ